jgi:PBP1b-binding outer membrane lipoprotein LpoB
MKQAVKLSLCVAVLFVLSGCHSIRTNTKASILPDNAVSKINVDGSVSLKNVAEKKGDIMIRKSGGWKVYADLYKYTDSAIGTAKNVLEKQNIKVADNADKVLELAVYDTKFVNNVFSETVSLRLRVRTGDGQEKEYTGAKDHGNLFSTTRAMEMALSQCVKQMLSDKDIVYYLEN